MTVMTGTAPSPRPLATPLSPSALPSLSAATLLGLARHGLVEAAGSTDPGERYATAHLAALRCAAAVLAARARPAPAGRSGRGSRTRPTSAWVLVAAVAPQLGEWARWFAEGAAKRAAAEAGITGAVTDREADDLLRDAETFLAVVETTLGLEGSQLLLPGA